MGIDPMHTALRSDRLQETCHLAKTMLSVRGEADAAGLAASLIDGIDALDDAEAAHFFRFLGSEFAPDPAFVRTAAEDYLAAPGFNSLLQLQQAVDGPRQELFRRMNRATSGTGAIVRMRARLLGFGTGDPELRAVDADLRHLLASWFNPGFLRLARLDWSSPASLLEKLIEHEAVHAITGWDDLRRRLQPDRRCFAFFHPQLPDEPLIFVEVALVPTMSTAIAPLIDASAKVLDADSFHTAMFYSISNCQSGLRGISMGTFLIKRVVDALRNESQTLREFCTLSPIPGLNAWLDTIGDGRLATAGRRWSDVVHAGWCPAMATDAQRTALLEQASRYIADVSTSAVGDPVARFHLSNGASLHRINWGADASPKGIRQSSGLMVNYLYDPQRMETNHEAFANGIVMRSCPAASPEQTEAGDAG